MIHRKRLGSWYTECDHLGKWHIWQEVHPDSCDYDLLTESGDKYISVGISDSYHAAHLAVDTHNRAIECIGVLSYRQMPHDGRLCTLLETAFFSSVTIRPLQASVCHINGFEKRCRGRDPIDLYNGRADATKVRSIAYGQRQFYRPFSRIRTGLRNR